MPTMSYGDMRPFERQSPRKDFTKAARGSRDQRDTIFEIHFLEALPLGFQDQIERRLRRSTEAREARLLEDAP